MQYPSFSKETINDEFVKLDAIHNEDQYLHKVSYLKGWLSWLLRKKLISLRDYEHYNIRLSTTKKPRNLPQHEETASNFKLTPTLLISLVIVSLLLGISLLLFFLVFNLSHTSTNNTIEQEGRTLSYKGKLNTTDGTQLAKRDMTFNLYVDEQTSESLYTGQCLGEDAIEPEFDGSFTIVIGADCQMDPIPNELFLKYQELYLGVTIGNEPELKPRYRVVTAGNSQNAERLQGLQTGSKAGTIPVISNDNIVLFDENSPTIKSTNGVFTLTGSTIHIQALDSISGTLLLDPGAAGKIIVPSGNLGIGLFDPKLPFVVARLNNDSSVGSIVNMSTLDSSDTNVLRLNLGTADNGSQSSFIDFYADALSDASGEKVGGIRLNNGGVAYETAGADFAEYMHVQGSVKPGIIISITSGGLKAASQDEPIIGVVSDRAGFVGNSTDTVGQTLVGMVGQLSVFVTNENGPILKGKPIIASSLFPGFGSSFNEAQSQFIVGYAAESVGDNEFTRQVCLSDMYIKDDIKCAAVEVILQPSRW